MTFVTDNDVYLPGELGIDGGNPLDTGMPDAMMAAIVVFGILFVGAIITMVAVSVHRYRKAQSQGIDLLTVDQDLAARLMQSEMLRPADGAAPAAAAAAAASRSIEERLRELDDLHERGLISADERAEARAKILAG
jgi:hypothetical protein